jgi:phospholipid/cholesterol/gamma-HCH transport system substrate-binding protein
VSQSASTPRTTGPGDLPPLPRTRAFDREAKVGLFVLISLAAIVIALFSLTDASMFRGRYILNTRVDDARGVRKGDPVVLRGVNIGRVKKFDIEQSSVRVFLEIEGEYPVSKDSRVEIRSSSLIQGMSVIIEPGKSQEKARQGDELQSGATTTTNIMDQASAVAVKAEDTLKRVDLLLSDATIKNVQDGTAEMNTTLRQLSVTVADLRKQLNTLMPSVQRSADTLEKTIARPEIDRSIARLDTITARMDEMTTSFKRSSAALETFVTRLDKGEGTLGKLSKDDELYANLNASIKSLNQTTTELATLSADIRKNPKKYFKFSVF